MERKDTQLVKVGKVNIGGRSRISIQSMTNTDSLDKEATFSQVVRLNSAGCDIVRVTVPDMEAAKQIDKIKENNILNK